MDKLISIIIPTYNEQKHIEECLDSIFTSYSDNILDRIEVIVIDDCSTDNTIYLLKEYAKQHPIIILRQERNQGQAAARNRGFREATGKYLWCVDGDDYLLPHAIEILVATLDVHPKTDLVQYHMLRFHDGKNDFKPEKCCGCPLKSKNGQKAFVEIVKHGKYSAYTVLRIVSRELVLKYSIFETENLIWDDTEWTPKLFAFAENVLYVPENLYAQRRIVDSTSCAKRPTRKHYTDQLVVISSLNKFMDENNISDDFRHALYSTLIGPLLNALTGVVREDGSIDEELLAEVKKYEYIMDYGNFKRKYVYRPFIKIFGLKAFCKVRK